MPVGFVDKEKMVSSTNVEWQDFVMKQFDKKELVDGYPTVAGLRRVCEIILGTCVYGKSHVVQSPSDVCGTAVVSYEVGFQKSPKEPVITFSSCADSNYDNTDKGFRCYLTAIAETRAEARALRKALRLNKSAIEEISKVAELDKELPIQASSLQIRALKNIIKTRKLNLEQVCKQHNIELSDGEMVLSSEEATRLIKELQR